MRFLYQYPFLITLACLLFIGCSSAAHEQTAATGAMGESLPNGAFDPESASDKTAEFAGTNDEDASPPETDGAQDNRAGSFAEEAQNASPEGIESDDASGEVEALPLPKGVNETAGFRISEFGILSPPLCMLSEDESSCDNVDLKVNEHFDSLINDDESPLDFVGVFAALPMDTTSSVTLSGASCFREDGEIISCDPIPGTEFAIVSISQIGDCNAGSEIDLLTVAPPCFVSETKDIQLFLQGMFIGMTDAQLMGTLEVTDGGYNVVSGYINGFVPESMAHNWLLDMVISGDDDGVSLDQILHNDARRTNDKGITGWNLLLGFSGSAIALESTQE